MQEHGIKARGKRKFVVTTDSKHNLPTAANLLLRNFTASAPNQVWTGDITYIATDEGWLYLAVINLREVAANAQPESNWLNVVQGAKNFSDTLTWWNAIKWFQCGGWAMAGHAGVNGRLVTMLALLLLMNPSHSEAQRACHGQELAGVLATGKSLPV